MRALTYQHGQLLLADVAEPMDTTPGVSIVDVIATGVCGTDLGVFRHGRPLPHPGVVMGHEILGTRRSTGQRVVVNPIVGCGACAACDRAQTQLCKTREVIGVHRDGGFTRSVNVPDANIVPVPEGASEARALFTEPLATALHAWRRGGAQDGARVAVIGAGAIGLAVALVARAHGCTIEACVELDAVRAQHALAAGVHSAGPELLSDGFDVIVDCVGAAATRRLAIDALVPGGTVVFVGLADSATEIDAAAIVAKEKTIHGAFGYSPADFRDAAALDVLVPQQWVQTVSLGQGAPLVTGQQKLDDGVVKIAVLPHYRSSDALGVAQQLDRRGRAARR